MDLRICNGCDRFRCRLVECFCYIQSGFSCRNIFIIAECNGEAVAIEPVGKAQMVEDRLPLLESKLKNISEDMLSDDIREDYGRAIDRIVESLNGKSDFSKCKYMAEQMVSEFNK